MEGTYSRIGAAARGSRAATNARTRRKENAAPTRGTKRRLSASPQSETYPKE